MSDVPPLRLLDRENIGKEQKERHKRLGSFEEQLTIHIIVVDVLSELGAII